MAQVALAVRPQSARAPFLGKLQSAISIMTASRILRLPTKPQAPSRSAWAMARVALAVRPLSAWALGLGDLRSEISTRTASRILRLLTLAQPPSRSAWDNVFSRISHPRSLPEPPLHGSAARQAA